MVETMITSAFLKRDRLTPGCFIGPERQERGRGPHVPEFLGYYENQPADRCNFGSGNESAISNGGERIPLEDWIIAGDRVRGHPKTCHSDQVDSFTPPPSLSHP